MPRLAWWGVDTLADAGLLLEVAGTPPDGPGLAGEGVVRGRSSLFPTGRAIYPANRGGELPVNLSLQSGAC